MQRDAPQFVSLAPFHIQPDFTNRNDGHVQVLGAKTYGVQILPPEPVPWSPPLIALNRTDEELMQKWSINQPPQWADIPLASFGYTVSSTGIQ